MNELTVLDNNIPIKSIPPEELNRIILTTFLTWISNLLSLTDETSANRLETALPAIKEHCWSMGFSEIKKMFEMYADNKLSIEPLPNYFDRILFGKIVKAYREQKPRVKQLIYKDKLTEKEKDDIILSGLKIQFEQYKQMGTFESGRLYLYEYLDEKGLLPTDETEKKEVYKQAINNLKKKKISY